MSHILHLDELAKAAGVSARTVRYYISRGLLPGPTMMGRKAHYTEVHLEYLKRIVTMQAEGLDLDQIKYTFTFSEFAPSVVPDPAITLTYALAPDVGVTVKSDIEPKRKRVVHQALATFARAVRVTEEEEG